MPLTTTIGSDGKADGVARLQVAGQLDSVTSAALERELTPILDGPAHTVVLDLAELSFITSAGIRVFLVARKRLAERNGALLLANPQPPVTKVFEIIRALPDLAVFRNVQELDSYLAEMQRKVRSGPKR